MKLPIQITANKDLQLMQNKWKSILDHAINGPLSSGIILSKQTLNVGKNVINHLLQQNLQGWMITRQNGIADIYDAQDSNQTPDLTLILMCNATVTIDIFVF